MNTEVFGRATDYARGVLADLTCDDLRQTTPCEGWDAGRTVVHLADVVDGLIGLVEIGELALPQPPRTNDPDPVALVYERLAKLTHAFSVATDASRVEKAALAGAIELTTHGWDIGVAVHPTHRIPKSLAQDVLALASPVFDIDGRGENFAPPVDPPRNATASDRLVAFLGRVPKR